MKKGHSSFHINCPLTERNWIVPFKCSKSYPLFLLLDTNYLHKLSSAKYVTGDDLKDVSPTELSEGKLISDVLTFVI